MEPLTQFAVALAALLQVAFPTISVGDTDLPVAAAWEPDPDVAMETADLDTPQIWTIGLGEVLGGDRGVAIEEYSLLVILQCKIAAGDLAAQVGALGQLAANMGRYCRPLEPSAAFVLNTDYANAVCTKVSRQPATNLAELRRGLYYTELLTTWKVC